MTYSIETTGVFDKWFATRVKDLKHRARIISRFDRIQMGNLGDYRFLDENLYELRFFFGPGFRIYFTIRQKTIVFLLCGGDKSSQSKDIQKARHIMEDLSWV
jgi:putative addiction module killer protein